MEGCCYLLWLKVYKARFKILGVAVFLLAATMVWFATATAASWRPVRSKHTYYLPFNLTDVRMVNIPSITQLRVLWIQRKLDRLSRKMEKLMVKKVEDVKEIDVPNERVHIFYFAWFRNIEEDGYWNHWQIAENASSPPRQIDSSYYPKLGCYSSRNMTIVEQHMKMIRKAGIGVVILSWVPPPSPDSPMSILDRVMDIAQKYKLKVTLQFENYDNRSLKVMLNQIKFFISKFGEHPAIYRLQKDSRKLPVFYFHETFQIKHTEWNTLLSSTSSSTIRGTTYDSVFLAHLTEQHQGSLIKAVNFDGFYTYSSANGLSYGSSWKNWDSLAKLAKEKSLMFVPCIGPGYKYDKDVKDTRHRLHGDYYEVGWRSGLGVKPEMIGINSFNNWQAGNQIEPAVPCKNGKHTYYGYEPEGDLFYLNLTLWWVRKFSEEN